MIPIIGITGDSTYFENSSYPEPHQVNYSPRDLTKAVTQAGGIPVIIPVNNPTLALKYAGMIDGLILAGGQDVSPHLYNEEPRDKIRTTSSQRDASEVALIEAVLSTGKPILGICRGLQLLNTVFGGTLYQDLSENEKITIKHVQETPTNHPMHKITVDPNSYMGSFVSQELPVNSLHHQVIRELGEGLKAVAVAQDGVIEAIESVDAATNVLAVQWHPESLYTTDVHALALFEDLVTRAKEHVYQLS